MSVRRMRRGGAQARLRVAGKKCFDHEDWLTMYRYTDLFFSIHLCKLCFNALDSTSQRDMYYYPYRITD